MTTSLANLAYTADIHIKDEKSTYPVINWIVLTNGQEYSVEIIGVPRFQNSVGCELIANSA